MVRVEIQQREGTSLSLRRSLFKIFRTGVNPEMNWGLTYHPNLNVASTVAAAIERLGEHREGKDAACSRKKEGEVRHICLADHLLGTTKRVLVCSIRGGAVPSSVIHSQIKICIGYEVQEEDERFALG